MWFWNQWFPGITGSRESLVPHIWECYRWVFRLCKPFFINWICFLAWKYLKPCAKRPLEMVCYSSWKLWNQWFPGTSDSREPLVPKPHEFPFKNLGTSDSLESVVPWHHLIPSADETTVKGPICVLNQSGFLCPPWLIESIAKRLVIRWVTLSFTPRNGNIYSLICIC